MNIRAFVLSVSVAVSLGCGIAAAADVSDTAGIVLAVQGTVTMQPATMTAPVKLRPFDEIGPLAILDSQAGSRCKVLYADDSLVTVGDNSRLEVTEQTYQSGSDQRAFDAGTSAVTARGTYFVTWLNGPSPRKGKGEEEEGLEMEGATGVANIGRNGNVAFTSGGATVLVLPGQFAIAMPGAPPSMPASIQTHIVPVATAISGTMLPDVPKQELPREALAEAGIIGGGTKGQTLAGPVMAKGGSLGGQAPSGSYMLPDWPFPVTPVTPPAVASGAAFSNTTVNLTIRLP
jgi:hypothetical protein